MTDRLKATSETGRPCSRRGFLAGASSVIALSLLPLPGQIGPQKAWAKTKQYPRVLLGKLSELKVGETKQASYPEENGSGIFLVKLGAEAGAGVGPDSDIVAYSSLCTHMGMVLTGTYKSEHHVMGPCPLHLTTFDLRRHGMVVSGHASQSLPQILLEVDGDEIYGVGVLGLLYGRTANLS